MTSAADREYGAGLAALGGRKFVGLLVIAGFMLLVILMVFIYRPGEARAWDFLDAAWPGFLFLTAGYMGFDVAQKIWGKSEGAGSVTGSVAGSESHPTGAGLESRSTAAGSESRLTAAGLESHPTRTGDKG